MAKSRAEEAVQALSHMVNAMGNSDKKEFIELMNREHRTLQQSFTGLCFNWIENCASDDYRTDPRNVASQEVSRDVLKGFTRVKDMNTVPSEWLPFI